MGEACGRGYHNPHSQLLTESYYVYRSVYLATVTLGFFDDILIPHQSLQHPKRLYPVYSETLKNKNYLATITHIASCLLNPTMFIDPFTLQQ